MRERTRQRGWENFTAACVAVGVAVAAAAFYASTRKCPNFFLLAFSALGSGSARRGFVSEFVFFALSLSLFPPPSSLSHSLSFSLFLFAGYHEALILFDCSSLCSLCRCCCRCEEEGEKGGTPACADLFNELGFCGVVRKLFCAFCHEMRAPPRRRRRSKMLLLSCRAGEMV